jgi:hypothetical protein
MLGFSLLSWFATSLLRWHPWHDYCDRRGGRQQEQSLAGLSPTNAALAVKPMACEAARQTRVICRRWADVDQFFAPIRNTLTGLVGFTGKNRPHPVLGSTKAYEVAYWKLYDAVAGLLLARSGGAEATFTARKLPPTLAITRWPRYVPLPTEQGVASNWAVQTVC